MDVPKTEAVPCSFRGDAILREVVAMCARPARRSPCHSCTARARRNARRSSVSSATPRFSLAHRLDWFFIDSQ